MKIVLLKKHIVNYYRCPLKKLRAPPRAPHLGMPSYATGHKCSLPVPWLHSRSGLEQDSVDQQWRSLVEKELFPRE